MLIDNYNQIQINILSRTNLYRKRTYMMASVKDDVSAFNSIKEKTRPRYIKIWNDFKLYTGAGDEFDSSPPTEEELSSFLLHLRQEKGAAS